MNRAGFTMIELVFVIVILGILAAVAVPKLTGVKAKAETAAASSNARTCINDLKQDYLLNKTNYANTAALETVSNACAAANSGTGGTITWKSATVVTVANTDNLNGDINLDQ